MPFLAPNMAPAGFGKIIARIETVGRDHVSCIDNDIGGTQCFEAVQAFHHQGLRQSMPTVIGMGTDRLKRGVAVEIVVLK